MNKLNTQIIEINTHLSSASGLDVIRTKPLTAAPANKVSALDDLDLMSGNQKKRLSPLLSTSICNMLSVPHLNDLFEQMATQLSLEGGYSLSNNNFQTYVEETQQTKRPTI